MNYGISSCGLALITETAVQTAEYIAVDIGKTTNVNQTRYLVYSSRLYTSVYTTQNITSRTDQITCSDYAEVVHGSTSSVQDCTGLIYEYRI